MSVREQNKGRRSILMGQENNALIALITINAVSFVLLKFINVIYLMGSLETVQFTQNVLNWVVVPADAERFLTRPWSLITSMFVDVQLFSLIPNMLWLWWFGYILQDLTGNRKLGPLYLYGGIAGGVFYLLTANLLPAASQQLNNILPLMGAGSSVMALAVATTLLAPDYRIFPMINGGIPLWVLTVVYVLIDFTTISAGPERLPISIAHLAAAGMGFLYIWRMRSGHDMGEWMHRFSHWLFTLLDPKKAENPAQKTKGEVFYEVKTGQQPFRKTPHITQQRIDELLDKIGKEGYHILTDEEKEYLKRASKDL